MPKPSPRRQYGTGSISFDAAKNRWIGSIEAGYTSTGTRRRIKITAKTEAEAKRKLLEKRRQINAEGLPAVGTSTRTTVKDWAEQWLENDKARLRPSSWNANRSSVVQWIIPTIGKKRLTDLSPADVRAASRAALDAGRVPATARRVHVNLIKCLRDAVLEGHQIPHRVLMTPGPPVGESQRDAMPLAHAHAILGAAIERPDGSRWVAALLQGMRQGECLGLTWECVDLVGGTIDVSWQLQPLPYNTARDRSSGFRIPIGYETRRLDGALHLVRPKSKSGRRIIPLVPWMAAALAKWRDAAEPNEHGLVWPRDCGRPQKADTDLAEWHALQDEVGVRHASGRYYHLHEARHTTATLLLEAGVSEAVVIAIMGHSSIITTRGYQHVSQALARRALDDVAARLQLDGLQLEA